MPWPEDLYALVAASQIDAAISMILERFNDVLKRSEYAVVDADLLALDYSQLDIACMMAIVTFTSPAIFMLTQREQALNVIQGLIEERDPEKAIRLARFFLPKPIWPYSLVV